MKRIISLIMALTLILTLFSACSKNAADEPATEAPTKEVTKTTVKLATLQGPTGMGMAHLLSDSDNGQTINKYEYTVASSPDEITGKLVSGDFDIAALPTNAAATLYNKTNGKIKLLALNTGCVLYILEKGDTIKSISDLKGKTVYVSGQGSTPEFVLDYLLGENGLKVGTDVNLDFTYSTHNDLVAFAAGGNADVVLLPEPAVTALISKNKDMRVALSINDVWADTVKDTGYSGTEIAMGCVAVNSEFADAHPDAVKTFLSEYEKSIKDVCNTENIDKSSETIAKVGIVAAAGVAKSALPRCNIIFEDGEEMQTKVEGFYNVLFDALPNSVGGKLPDENFYYKAK